MYKRNERVGYIHVPENIHTGLPVCGVKFDDDDISTRPVQRWQFDKIKAIYGDRVKKVTKEDEDEYAGNVVEDIMDKQNYTAQELAALINESDDVNANDVHRLHIGNWRKDRWPIPEPIETFLLDKYKEEG